MTSSVHLYLNWEKQRNRNRAKERIDEMDAVLESLEDNAAKVTAESRARALQLIADLRKKRNACQEIMEKHAAAGEAAWLGPKARLDAEWSSFQSAVKKYVDSFGQAAAGDLPERGCRPT